MLKFGDLFSGMSCPAFALKQLGIPFSYEFACDIDRRSKQFLIDNHQPKIIFNDVRKIETLPKVDIVVMGFPCQPFSLVNTKKAMEKHTSHDLWIECIRCINLCDPTIFILENVATLLHKDKISYFNNLMNGLQEIGGYNIDFKVLNSKDYGVPQSRNRVWIIGTKGFTPKYPTPCPLLYNLKSFIDLDEPLILDNSKSTRKPNWDNSLVVDILYISNGQGTGAFAQYYKWPIEHAYCVLLKNAQMLFRIDENKIVYSRRYTVKEYCRLFYLNTDIVGNHNLCKLLGNGMDIHMLQLLMKLNIDSIKI